MNVATYLPARRQGEQLEYFRQNAVPCCFVLLLTVTGASTRCTLLSSTRISLARRHRALTSPSLKYSHRLRRSICSSKHEFPPLVNEDAVMLVVRGGKAGGPLGTLLVLSGITAAISAGFLTMAALIFVCVVLCVVSMLLGSRLWFEIVRFLVSQA